MTINRITVSALLALSAVTILPACTPTKQVSTVTPAAGFLPDPSLLQSGKEGEARLVYVNQTVPLSSYDKVILDPVTVWTAPGSHLEDVPAEQRQVLADTLHSNLYNAFAQRCQMVDRPGPGTMRVRIALVDAEQSNATANTIATYVPQARLLDTLASAAFNDGVGYFVGSASAEGYATDSTNGTVLWQGVDKRAGGNAVGSDTFDSWNDTDNAFKAWADQVTDRLARLGICPGGQEAAQ